MKSLIHIRRFIWSRLLPKTGQITRYQDGDDGFYEHGWWQGLDNADNKIRFIEKVIGGEDIVLDLATGLMWAKDPASAGGYNGNIIAWAAAIPAASDINFAGFRDWYLPNVQELFSVINQDIGVAPNQCYTENPFIAAFYVSSTTCPADTTKCFHVRFSTGAISERLKTDNGYMKICRQL